MEDVRKSFTKVTEVISRERTFYVLVDERGQYWGIEDDGINIVSCIVKKQYNGLTGLLSDTVEECTQRILDQIEVDYLVQVRGFSPMVASAIIIGGVDEKEAAKLSIRFPK